MKNETYNIYVECLNCKWSDKIDIAKGVRISEKECPECGCKTLIKL